MHKLPAFIFFMIFLFLLPPGALSQYDDEIEKAYGKEENEKEEKEVLVFSPADSNRTITVRMPDPGKVAQLKKDDAFWYAALEPERKKELKAEPGGKKKSADTKWFQDLLWILILCSFIAIVIWYLASSNIRLFGRKAVAIKDVEEEEALPEDIFSINYDEAIYKATGHRNYRLAIRLWYLRSLKLMAEKEIITYRKDKTDSAYLAQLSGSSYRNDFFFLLRAFEYSWYGQFSINATQYGELEKRFISFQNRLGL